MPRIVSLLALALLILGSLADGQSLSDRVTGEAVLSHLSELDLIAQIDGLNSRSVLKNYNASVEYVVRQLLPFCPVQIQSYQVAVHEELETPSLSLLFPSATQFQHGVDFRGMRNGGSGQYNLTVGIQEVIGGCSAADFAGFVRGRAALIQEGPACTLVSIAFLAEQAGASAILFYNRPTTTSLLSTRIIVTGWKEGDPLVEKPVFSLSNLLGKTLKSYQGAVVSLYANMRVTKASTLNVICESNTGSKNDVVMAGAHLDSVPEGPGLNDNGSGSASLLEIAIQYFKLGEANKNAVRFAWWGAEEIGLLGSRHYVRDLQTRDPASLERIALYLNFDMLGSPNFVPFVYDPYVGTQEMPEETRAASQKLQFLFEDYFKKVGYPYALDGMYGGSDYRPFCEAGIPCGGLYTGSSELKTSAQRQSFGGFANAQLDPCYHVSCDSLLNIDKDVLEQNSKATADVIQTLGNLENLRDFLGTATATSSLVRSGPTPK